MLERMKGDVGKGSGFLCSMAKMVEIPVRKSAEEGIFIFRSEHLLRRNATVASEME